jgi:hypothetical protein
LTSNRIVWFEGVIVGFESPPGYSEPSVFIQGSINGENKSFYLLIPRDKYEEFLMLGVGQIINGRASIVSEDPLILKLIS